MPNLKKLLPAAALFALALAIWAGCETARQPVPAAPAATGLRPGPDDPRIALVTARLLETYHYSQRPLDENLSEKFFDGYIDSLDPRHENFLQSDLDEFSVYRTNLDRLTVGGRGTVSDLTPAFAIYDRYAQRIQQHDAYAQGMLQQDKFKFGTPDEKILLDRRHAPFPTNLVDAEALWLQRLRYEYLQEKLAQEITETNGGLVVKKLPPGAAKDIADTLERHYRWNLRMTTNWDSDGVLQAYLNALAHAYDPHSDYMSAPHAQDFSIGMNLALFGIGAQLTEDDGYCTIRSLVPGGPATKSKQVNEKDRIIAVAQGTNAPVDVVDMELEKVVQMIRGAKGTEVRLTISPAADRAARKIVSLVRDEIKLEDSEARAKLVELPDGHGGTNRIGIIDLPSFYAPVGESVTGGQGRTTPKYTSVDVAKLLKRLKQEKVSGVIVDLRSNPGGSLEEAIRFTGLFIKGGPVVLARNPDGQVTVDSDPDNNQVYDGPLVVMVNRFSASASEIAAAALQDYGRAVVVGDVSTHGKGTVQNLNPLKPFMPGDTNDPGLIKITIRKFYRVSGASTQFKGVTPDIVLPDVLNHSDQVGEAALDNALPWDTIQPVNYAKLNLVSPYLPTLKARSDTRVATNQDFLYVKEDIAQFLKQQADKTATINERAAVKEREKIYAINKARDAERSARPPTGIKVYEITVKNADQPGLVEFRPASDDAGIAAEIHPPAAMIKFTMDQSFSDLFASNDVPAIVKYLQLNPALTNQTKANLLDLLTNQFVVGSAAKPSTNTVNQAKPAKPGPPPFDPMLDEAQRILLDYISLLAKNGVLMAHD